MPDKSPLYKIAVIILVLFNLLLCSWYVLHGDLYFHTDISRDFLLLNELEQKKVILIGARAGAAGFFHGPLWVYLNYPVYYFSNGNPVASGFFWVFLITLSLLASFLISRKIFGERTAYLNVLLFSLVPIAYANNFTHPHLGILVTPVFFYSLILYGRSFKLRYLALNIILGGILIQLEIALGLPLMILTFVYALYLTGKNRLLWHMSAYILLLIPLSTYIIFDLRHNFFLTNNFLAYLKGNPYEYYVGFNSILKNRLEYITLFALGFIDGSVLPNRIISVIFLSLLLLLIINNDRHKKVYKIFFYLFFGYFLLSLKNRYYLLNQHFVGFIPVVVMMVASLAKSRYSKYVVLIFLLIVVNNEIEATKLINNAKGFTGINESSWKFYADLSKSIFSAGPEKEFGYFIYTPDKMSYSPKYAMIYGAKNNPSKKAYYFEKRPVTYVIVAPPPENDPYMLGDWWVENTINIKNKPDKVINFPNGYKIERFIFTEEETRIPWDKTADTGIHFR